MSLCPCPRLRPTLTLATALAALSLCVISLAQPRGLPPAVDSKSRIERLSPSLDKLLAPDAKVEILAEGFNWSEGPLWWPATQEILFSDVPENRVYRWSPSSGLGIFLEPSGFTGEHYDGRERGSNGLTLSPKGELALAQHGDRRVALYRQAEKQFITIADRFEGRRFSSPNDLCFNRRGDLFFTDPPYGLPNRTEPEQPVHGVYHVAPSGEVRLLTGNLERPNGIALSPDERTLYVANSHGPRPIIMALSLDAEQRVVEEKVFFDGLPLIEREKRPGAFDGLKVDTEGNLWASGPGGILILSAKGEHLGTILTGRATANCAFGGEDHRTLYITADEALLRVSTRAKGNGPAH